MNRSDIARGTALAALILTPIACGISNQAAPVSIESASRSTDSSTTQPTEANSADPVTLYFVSSSNRLVATQAGTVRDIESVMNHLLGGPTSRESAAGLTSAIPGGTKVLSSKVAGSLVSLDFSDQLASVSGQEQVLAFAQIVGSATSLPGISAVQVSVSGQVVNAPLPDGTLAQRPVTRADYANLFSG